MNDEMMRAAAFAEPGGPEVLRVTELPAPQAGPGQVRVRVRTAGVQPFDAAVRAGWVPQGLTGGLPRIPGNEFAGVVDQVGEGVTGVSAGAEVLGFSLLKCYAEYVVVPAGDVTGKPASMPWEVAGGLTAGAQTAEPALDALAVGEGDTLLVHAAAGAVGTVAVQVPGTSHVPVGTRGRRGPRDRDPPRRRQDRPDGLLGTGALPLMEPAHLGPVAAHLHRAPAAAAVLARVAEPEHTARVGALAHPFRALAEHPHQIGR